MANKPVIISGEASETDSEEEILLNKNFSHIMRTSAIQGSVITGEDTESENENEASVCSAVSALNENHVYETDQNENSSKTDSLLHQKLRECNIRLQTNIDSFCQNSINEACKSLNGIDQQLIKSQLTLQSAVTSLKSLTANSLALKNKLQSLLSAQFIPNINVDK